MPEIKVVIAFATGNIVLHVVAVLVLVGVWFQVRRMSRITERLYEAADKMASAERSSATEIARLAKEISTDIGKLRDIGSSDDGAQDDGSQLHSLH